MYIYIYRYGGDVGYLIPSFPTENQIAWDGMSSRDSRLEIVTIRKHVAVILLLLVMIRITMLYSYSCSKGTLGFVPSTSSALVDALWLKQYLACAAFL